jgi:hypothetical protein
MSGSVRRQFKKRLLSPVCEGKYKVRGMDVQFLLPAGQAKVTLTSERTRGWRKIL